MKKVLLLLPLVLLLGCVGSPTSVPVDRSVTESAWFYERYTPRRDRHMRIDGIPARILLFREVHVAGPLYDDAGVEIGHWDGWRTELEVFFSPNQLPQDPMEVALQAIERMCGPFEVTDIREEHPNYVRLAGQC